MPVFFFPLEGAQDPQQGEQVKVLAQAQQE